MNKIILITGATSGIGRATVPAIARQGAAVIVDGLEYSFALNPWWAITC